MSIQFTAKRISELQLNLYKIDSCIEAWAYQADAIEINSQRMEYIRRALDNIYMSKKHLETARNFSARTKA